MKHVLNMFRGNVFRKIFAQCNLESRVRKRLEKMENFNISKVSKTVPNIVQTCSEPVLRYFFQKKVASAPWRVEAWKKLKKKTKVRNFQNSPKTFPKNIVWECFDWFFRRKKLCPVHPGDSKKFHRNRKEFKFSKTRKTFPKASKLALGNFSNFSCPLHPGGSKLGKNRKKNEKRIIFRKRPKTFLKVSKQVLNLFVCNFSEKHAQCTL